jgi:hypothetical protein
MANTFLTSGYSLTLGLAAIGSTGARHSSNLSFSSDYKSSGSYFVTKMLVLSDYDLTVAAGNLDIDLYDLGTLDVGSGSGRDNLGNTWSQSKVHSIVIENSEGSAGSLRIDQAGLTTTAWKGLFGGNAITDLPAGSCVSAHFGSVGVSITDVTDHMLRLSAQTGDCTISLHIAVS